MLGGTSRLSLPQWLTRGPTRYTAAIAFAVYLVGSVWLFGRPLRGDPAHTCLCIGTTTDEGTYAWALEWWPHALLHGLNPFHPDIIYAPQGINIAHAATMPALALLAAPVTALAGPLLTFNIAALMAPALAGLFAFLLCRRLTGAFWPALVGGWLFGFSSYMLGEETGHLNLTFVFLIPAIVHLVLRWLAGEFTRRRFVVLLTIALVGQFLLSTEVFATMTVFGVIALVLWSVIGGAPARATIRTRLAPLGLSYLATAVIVSPYLYYVLQPGGPPVDVPRAEMFSNDLLGFVMPGATTRIGGVHFASTTGRFTGGFVEANAYLGLPLIALVLWSVRDGWRRREVRCAAALLAVIALCSLGARLHVDAHTSIPLPWALVQRIPLIGIALPGRFNLYLTLVAACLAAIVLARRGVVAWLLGLLAIASLWPGTEIPLWHSRPDLPPAFATDAWKRLVGPRDTALVLPIGIEGNSMLWQAEARLGFTMAGGYVVPPGTPDPYSRDPIYPTLTYGYSVPRTNAAAARFIATHHVTVAILPTTGSVNAAPWLKILPAIGWRSRTVDGVIVFRPGSNLTAALRTRSG